MVKINNSDDLREWFKGKPLEFSVVIASRAALRVLPVLEMLFFQKEINGNQRSYLLLVVFRTLFLSISFSKYSMGREAKKQITSAAFDARSVHATVNNSVNIAALFAIDSAANAADTVSSFHGGDMPEHAVSAAIEANFSVDAAVGIDRAYLDQKNDSSDVARSMLWSIGMPGDLCDMWGDLKKILLELDQDWQVWTDWYEDILAGRNRAELPDDLAEELDLKIALQENDWWKRGPAKVNADIAAWTDAALAEAGEESEIQAEAEEAEAAIEEMSQWFLSNFEDPAMSTPYESREGGYLYLRGGPFDAAEEIGGHFSEQYSEDLIDQAVEFVQSDGLFDWEAVDQGDEREENQNTNLLSGEPEQQNGEAIRFESHDGEPIGVYHGPDDALLDDHGAVDRHFETKRLSDALINSYDPTEPGANAVTQLINDVNNYRSAIGEAPNAANVNFLIPRGEGLRLMLRAQLEIDDLSDLPPISDKYKLALEKLVVAHNAFVSLDPVLAKRDEALLGPDAKVNLVAPLDGMQFVVDAVIGGVAKPEVAEVLEAEASNAPAIPDVENRTSRRFSEGVKNFARKVVADVSDWVAISALIHKGKIAKGVVGAVVAVSVGVTGVTVGGTVGAAAALGGVVPVYFLGKWMLKNEKWFLEVFSDKPAMLELTEELFEFLRKLPHQ